MWYTCMGAVHACREGGAKKCTCARLVAHVLNQSNCMLTAQYTSEFADITPDQAHESSLLPFHPPPFQAPTTQRRKKNYNYKQ